MKILKSETTVDLNDLPRGKCRIHINGDDVESIWVANDVENGKMYFLNSAVMFYPFYTWGTEYPISKDLNMHPYRGDTPDDTELTYHPLVYEEFIPLLQEDGIHLDYDKFAEQQAAAQNKQSEEDNSDQDSKVG